MLTGVLLRCPPGGSLRSPTNGSAHCASLLNCPLSNADTPSGITLRERMSVNSLSSEIFVARQPILDRHRRVVAYELLFRDSANAAVANVEEGSLATARVAIDSILSMGISTLLGPHQGFLNVDLEMLASEAIEALPHERFVLEVLETVPPWALERCDELRARGYQIALDDFVPGDARHELLGSADYVKVDLTLTSRDALPLLVEALQAQGVRLLAEKVETHEEFDECMAMGFELFQGYFFAKPTTFSGKSLDLQRSALLAVFRAVSTDQPTGEIEQAFKRDARLGIQLLRIANSAALGAIGKITSFEHAIMYVGRKQLRRWILLMLYASGSGDLTLSPAIEVAAVRGRLLELLVPLVPSESAIDPEARDAAFLAGMLSVGGAILGVDPGAMIDELGVQSIVGAAVLERKGPLGSLLRISEAIEAGRFDDLGERLEAVGLSSIQLKHALSEAYAWYRQAGIDDAFAQMT